MKCTPCASWYTKHKNWEPSATASVVSPLHLGTFQPGKIWNKTAAVFKIPHSILLIHCCWVKKTKLYHLSDNMQYSTLETVNDFLTISSVLLVRWLPLPFQIRYYTQMSNSQVSASHLHEGFEKRGAFWIFTVKKKITIHCFYSAKPMTHQKWIAEIYCSCLPYTP